MVAALLVSGCGSSFPDPKMTVTYEKARTGPALVGSALMSRSQLLERVAERINATMDLPYDIALVGAQCGEANAFWNFAEKKITICYEDADLSMRSFQRAGDPGPIPAGINAAERSMRQLHGTSSSWLTVTWGSESPNTEFDCALRDCVPSKSGSPTPESLNLPKRCIDNQLWPLLAVTQVTTRPSRTLSLNSTTKTLILSLDPLMKWANSGCRNKESAL